MFLIKENLNLNALIYGADRFTVASYNILGDRNASKHKDLYLNVPSDYLRWGYRKRVLFDELMRLNPDIICLQVSLLFFLFIQN